MDMSQGLILPLHAPTPEEYDDLFIPHMAPDLSFLHSRSFEGGGELISIRANFCAISVGF